MRKKACHKLFPFVQYKVFEKLPADYSPSGKPSFATTNHSPCSNNDVENDKINKKFFCFENSPYLVEYGK